MRLVLIRHGIAQELNDVPPRPSRPVPTDSDRALTPKGRKRVKSAAAGLREIGVAADVIFHSGLRRARETAELMVGALAGKRRALQETEALVPAADPAHFIGELQKQRAKNVVAVGHAPNLDRVIAFLVGEGAKTITELGKAGAAALELELESTGRGAGRLEWLLTPRMLRRLGRRSNGRVAKE
jgi:phosphohistidine phosphatase